MTVKPKIYHAKSIKLKLAVVENGTSFKKLAENTNSGYQTIIQLAAGTNNTSELRARAIARELNKNVEDLFEEVR
ncbi:hypothetical protein [Staphylococcus sp. LKG3-3]|uniref:hypothetical protein n=1 Tax=Staphylococcus sp. LKG3-3 TaxID=3399685 RepID=UPI003D3D723A